jgi:hypothetical protein
MFNFIHIVYLKFSHSTVSANQSDLLNMIRALHKTGQKIHFHCFYPVRVHLESIEEYCEAISLYAERIGVDNFTAGEIRKILGTEKSRLVENLKQDDYPIICHGYQACKIIFESSDMKGRNVLFRLLRNEPQYLSDLAKVTPWGLRKLFYLISCWQTAGVFKNLLGHKKIAFSNDSIKPSSKTLKIQEFRGSSETFFKEGFGSFCLYHGDLSKRENEFAAQWLLEHVFNNLEIPFVIAGKDPSEQLEQAAHVRMHTCLVSNPGEMEMKELIKKAQIILLPTFIEEQSQDFAMHALLLGRHVLVNSRAAKMSPFESLFDIAETPEEFRDKTEKLFSTLFVEEQKNKRLYEISQIESDDFKAKAMINLLELPDQ